MSRDLLSALSLALAEAEPVKAASCGVCAAGELCCEEHGRG